LSTGSSLQPLAFAGALVRSLPRCRVAKALRGFTRGNEKFHISPISQHYSGEFMNTEDSEKSIRFLS
jgi:hypothetical protein